MNKSEILRYNGKVIDQATLSEIRASEDVKVIRDNGMSGAHIGKRWYVVVFKSGDGISVFCSRSGAGR